MSAVDICAEPEEELETCWEKVQPPVDMNRNEMVGNVI